MQWESASESVDCASGSVRQRQAGVRPRVRVRRARSTAALASRGVAAGAAMLLAAPSAALRARLTEKTRYRATALVDPLLPAGSGSIETVPTLGGARDGVGQRALALHEPTEVEVKKYYADIRRTARVFARFHMKKGTLAEHDKYMIWIDSWARLSGFT